MKMTRLEWRYLQRIALDHPYFDTHELPLTEKEAKAIVEANNRMTGKEFVDSIYAKLGMTRPKEKRTAWLRNIGELFAVPPIRKIAIVALIIIFMTVFFAATPIGRAIAESVIQYIGTLFDDGRIVFNRNDNEAMMIPLDTAPDSEEGNTLKQENSDVYVNTFEEFTKTMGVRPMVLPFPYTELKYYYDEFDNYLRLRAEYETPKGTVITFQIWNALDSEVTTSTGFTVYDDDPSIYYSFENNGMMTVMKLYEDSIFGIIAEDSYTVDEIISILTAE